MPVSDVAPSISLPKLLEQCKSDSSYTPDLQHLSAIFDTLAVFIYGTEKTAFSDDYAMWGAKKMGAGVTSDATYDMFLTETAGPVVLHNPMGDNAAAIFGEIYQIKVPHLVNMDARMTNGLIFNRRIKQIRWCPWQDKDQQVKRQFLSEAYMYIGDYTYWKNRNAAEGFKFMKAAKRFTPEGDRAFFSYTNADDQELQKRILGEGMTGHNQRVVI